MPLADTPDLRAVRTTDGSLTLRSDRYNEQYHSLHGAVQESTHVFINNGLLHVLKDHDPKKPVDLLEVGLGTGLDLLLTWIRCLEGKCSVNYTALEPFPVSRQRLEELAHWEELAWPGLKEPFLAIMTADEETMITHGALCFQRLAIPVQQWDVREVFDLVYYDAFGPSTQPEMWTQDVFERMFAALRPGGVLVTYCASGQVGRNMRAAGLAVERLPGPPGKREMIRATRP
jgi:tRNA U34 5-methylaminomethyl-2-thiouridine-forming methyltransferase MnmC